MHQALFSPLLSQNGFRHAFALSAGPQEPDPRRSAGDGAPDGAGPRESLDELRRRTAGAVGCAIDRLFEVTQVHGSRVEKIGSADSRSEVLPREADALVTREPSVALGVRVADCLPLLLADPDTGAVAAIHAGWRGVVDGVVTASLDALLSLPGVRVERLLAASFPHIRSCCFEVGPDVARQLQAAGAGARVVHGSEASPRVDLAAIVRAQLLSRGVAHDRVDDVAGCSFCDQRGFFSYRRQGAGAGRHLAAIAAGVPSAPPLDRRVNP